MFTNISGAINAVSAYDCAMGVDSLKGKFCSETDSAILEDSSGRISIRESDKFHCDQFSTGSIIALLGQVDRAGYFICDDFCFAGVPYKN